MSTALTDTALSDRALVVQLHKDWQSGFTGHYVKTAISYQFKQSQGSVRITDPEDGFRDVTPAHIIITSTDECFIRLPTAGLNWGFDHINHRFSHPSLSFELDSLDVHIQDTAVYFRFQLLPEAEQAKIHDILSRRPSSTLNTPLPPSVEKAYYRKCIELKRRINEVEESNDAYRLRKIRLDRAILKMRLERAFLLEQLQKRMEYNVDESDRSTSPPPTVSATPTPQTLYLDAKYGTVNTYIPQPQDKPMRSKRAHRKNSPDTATSPPQPQAGSYNPNAPLISPSQSSPEHARAVFPRPTTVNGSAIPPSGSSDVIAAQPPYGTPIAAAPAPGFAAVNQGPPPQENGGVEYSRDRTGGGVAGEAVGAGPEITIDANGERRVAPDTEMADAGPGGAGGFTAVNR
ncbi:MAG: hypothetical protein M1820_004718 [Bogoriella megaspora]|nr:MAG: hypothetical protein M1820_004718 [Bogoriella megaspora]